jgi:hypothetical protein
MGLPCSAMYHLMVWNRSLPKQSQCKLEISPEFFEVLEFVGQKLLTKVSRDLLNIDFDHSAIP